ncbi:MAG: hypothetical protein AAF749_08130 [Pseudomonadota bacterium]
MLLRRVTKHVREQNWFAVFLDLLVVVLGVFIGLQGQDWNDDRLRRLESKSILARIESEFKLMHKTAERRRGVMEQNLLAGSRIVEGLQSGTLASDTLDDDLTSLVTIMPLPPPSVVFAELQASGRLDLVLNRALTDALYEYNAWASLLAGNTQSLTQPFRHARQSLARVREVRTSGIPSKEDADRSFTYVTDASALLADLKLHAALRNAYVEQDNFHTYNKRSEDLIQGVLNQLTATVGAADIVAGPH